MERYVHPIGFAGALWTTRINGFSGDMRINDRYEH